MNWLAFINGLLVWFTMPTLFNKPKIEDAPHGLEKEWFENQTAQHRHLTVCFVALVAAYIVSVIVSIFVR